ncbi:MAG: hypothetical protein ABIO70_23460 [Pseudomonadota bacterium]
MADTPTYEEVTALLGQVAAAGLTVVRIDGSWLGLVTDGNEVPIAIPSTGDDYSDLLALWEGWEIMERFRMAGLLVLVDHRGGVPYGLEVVEITEEGGRGALIYASRDGDGLPVDLIDTLRDLERMHGQDVAQRWADLMCDLCADDNPQGVIGDA